MTSTTEIDKDPASADTTWRRICGFGCDTPCRFCAGIKRDAGSTAALDAAARLVNELTGEELDELVAKIDDRIGEICDATWQSKISDGSDT